MRDKRPLHLINDNRGWFCKPTMKLSTVKLPLELDGIVYESCLFHTAGATQIIERYSTFDDAVFGHVAHATQYNLPNVISN